MMDDLSVLPVILVGNVRKSAQSVCVTIRGCLAVGACSNQYPSLKLYLFCVLRRCNDAHSFVRNDAKTLVPRQTKNSGGSLEMNREAANHMRILV